MAKNIANENTWAITWTLNRMLSTVFPIFILAVSITLLLAIIGKFVHFIPEPKFRFKSPFGKLPFFDGVMLYGFVILVLCGLMSRFLY